MREHLERYLQLLLQTNAHTNLTAIRDPEEIRVRHFEDSLRLLEGADFSSKRVIDIGSGAGFPGLVLKIAEPTIKLTLLDAAGKKVRFLQSVCDDLGLSDVSCVHARAEELARDPAHRERYDIVTARGVAALPALCEICLPFVRTGGIFLSMKRPGPASDARFAGTEEEGTPELFGGAREEPFVYQLSDGRTHAVCRFRKCTRTLPQYPRSWGKIKGGQK
jgi:16S rRNA (guanine527-N7)-methyltransferase